jgi:hypothetical protein
MLVPVPAAAPGTPEQRAACEGNAMRLCGNSGAFSNRRLHAAEPPLSQPPLPGRVWQAKGETIQAADKPTRDALLELAEKYLEMAELPAARTRRAER